MSETQTIIPIKSNWPVDSKNEAWRLRVIETLRAALLALDGMSVEEMIQKGLFRENAQEGFDFYEFLKRKELNKK